MVHSLSYVVSGIARIRVAAFSENTGTRWLFGFSLVICTAYLSVIFKLMYYLLPCGATSAATCGKEGDNGRRRENKGNKVVDSFELRGMMKENRQLLVRSRAM